MKTSLLQYFLKCTPLSVKLISADLAVYVMLKVIFVDADDFLQWTFTIVEHFTEYWFSRDFHNSFVYM